MVTSERVDMGAIAKWPVEVETDESGIPAQLMHWTACCMIALRN